MRPGREHRRLPGALAEGRGDRGRLLFGYFLLAEQEKVTALPGAYPGPWCLFQSSVFYAHQLLIGMRRRGFRPRTTTHFSCFAKKSKQKKATPVPLSFRFAPGNLRCSRHGLHCATRTVHCVHYARTSAMSQFTKREVPRAAHGTALLGRGTGGSPIRAIAALGLGLGPSLRSALAGWEEGAHVLLRR